MTTDTGEKIRAGKAIPIEERQARWDRMKAWQKAGRSLEEIVHLEDAHQKQREADGELSQEPLSRERIRAILARARPGTVGRPKLPGLYSEERTIEARIVTWQARKKQGDPRAVDSISTLRAQLKAVKAEIKAVVKSGGK